jgi:hypothetical protein
MHTAFFAMSRDNVTLCNSAQVIMGDIKRERVFVSFCKCFNVHHPDPIMLLANPIVRLSSTHRSRRNAALLALPYGSWRLELHRTFNA